jgi:hypothetical protein
VFTISSTNVSNAAIVGAACSCIEPELSTTKITSTAVQPQSSSPDLHEPGRSPATPTSKIGSSVLDPSGVLVSVAEPSFVTEALAPVESLADAVALIDADALASPDESPLPNNPSSPSSSPHPAASSNIARQARSFVRPILR